jgi:hypothetical protein
VLLALLTPALDKAIFEAEMAVDMAQHGGIAKGATAYAMGFRRLYPYRPTMDKENGQFERIQSGLVGGVYNDDRPILRQFMGMKMFQCPFNDQVDYDTTRNDVWILPSTLLWFSGRGLIDKAGQKYRPMRRVGDRVEWSGPRHPFLGDTEPRTWAFDYLASETDWNRMFDQVRTAHPDDEGVLSPEALQGESVFLVLLGVRSRWRSYETGERGSISQIYARTDGSVRRINDIKNHDPQRTVEVPEFENDGEFPNNAEHLPVD